MQLLSRYPFHLVSYHVSARSVRVLAIACQESPTENLTTHALDHLGLRSQAERKGRYVTIYFKDGARGVRAGMCMLWAITMQASQYVKKQSFRRTHGSCTHQHIQSGKFRIRILSEQLPVWLSPEYGSVSLQSWTLWCRLHEPLHQQL